jgi:hypothetical protein
VTFGDEGSQPWGHLINRPIALFAFEDVTSFPASSLASSRGAGVTTYSINLPRALHVTPYVRVNAQGAGSLIKLCTDKLYSCISIRKLTSVMGEYITKAGEQSHESLGWQCAEKVFFDIPDTVTAIELGYSVSVSFAMTASRRSRRSRMSVGVSFPINRLRPCWSSGSTTSSLASTITLGGRTRSRRNIC